MPQPKTNIPAERKEMGRRIKDLRKRKLGTQQRAADAMGVDLRRWQRYEADGTTKWKTAEWIAEILGVSADFIMLGKEQKAPADLENRLVLLEAQVAELVKHRDAEDAAERARRTGASIRAA